MSNKTFISITPSDSATITPTTDPLPGVSVLYVGVSGDIAMVAAGDTDPVVLKGVPTGWFRLPGRVNQINATNTTATNLIGVQWISPYLPSFAER
jgi:hypothetical protein